jgi:hypothetical protein
MSSDGHTSEASFELPAPKRMRMKKDHKQVVSSSGHTSENTQASEMPKKQKKAKKDPRRMPEQPKSVKSKLSEQVAEIFAAELSGGAEYVDPSEILQKFITPQNTTSTTSTKTMVRIVTTVIEQTRTTKKTTSEKGVTSSTTKTMKAKYKISGSTYSLDDLDAITALQNLVDRFGKVSHMGILDKSYTFFISKPRDAALYFKVLDKVAVVGGDPLCEPEKYDSILKEFAAYRKTFGWSLAFLGATSEFSSYARGNKWPTFQFGVERVLNPMTNPVLLETGMGKRTISNSKALLKKNVKLGIYIPSHGSDSLLQSQLSDIYAAWCIDRNKKPIVQAYMTVLDPFAMPDLMVYIYTRDLTTGAPNGFAALRKIVNGYHLDPCIALPGAARGISELLILSAMGLLRGAGVSYLSLGFEPSPELRDITGIPEAFKGMTRTLHKRAFRRLPIGGKQAFFDKFRPDDNQQGDLYLIIPTRGLPGLRHMKALMHTANIDISKLIFEDVKKSLSRQSGDEGGKTAAGVEQETGKGSEDLSSRESSSQEISRTSSGEQFRR